MQLKSLEVKNVDCVASEINTTNTTTIIIITPTNDAFYVHQQEFKGLNVGSGRTDHVTDGEVTFTWSPCVHACACARAPTWLLSSDCSYHEDGGSGGAGGTGPGRGPRQSAGPWGWLRRLCIP